MFTKDERSTFPYWFAHWCAFQMTALNMHIWKPKYLLHDIEKPWLMLIWKDYKRVQKWHREHNSHHLEYTGKYDIDAMIIDWECSRFTKAANPENAREYWERITETWEKQGTIKSKFDCHHELQFMNSKLEQLGL